MYSRQGKLLTSTSHQSGFRVDTMMDTFLLHHREDGIEPKLGLTKRLGS